MMVVENQYMAATSAVQQSWTPFTPSSQWLGSSGGMVPYGTFNGVVQKVQASATVVPVVEEGARASMAGGSSMSFQQLQPVYPGMRTCRRAE